jgi:hypothetical protein
LQVLAILKLRRIGMNKAEHALELFKDHCAKSTGIANQWIGKSNTYQFDIGRPTANGTINGVIRKLAGTDVSGKHIWAVAGSIKIDVNGEFHRGTGIPRSLMKDITSQADFLYTQEKAQSTAKATVTV